MISREEMVEEAVKYWTNCYKDELTDNQLKTFEFEGMAYNVEANLKDAIIVRWSLPIEATTLFVFKGCYISIFDLKERG